MTLSKICHGCTISKKAGDFSPSRHTKDGLKNVCKACRCEEEKKRRLNNPEKMKVLAKRRYEKHKNKILLIQKLDRQNNPLKYKIRDHEKYEKNKDKSEFQATKLKWRMDNLEKINANNFNRYHNDIEFKLRSLMRSRINLAVDRGSKAGSAVRDLGCTIKEFKIYIETKFYPNPRTGELMTWKNWTRDGWHLDHIRPLAKFNLENPKDLKEAASYRNYQPLWWFENIAKSDK